MFELIFEFVAEFLVQVVGSALVEIGFHAIAEPFRKAPNASLAAFGYAILGLFAGGISILLFSVHFVSSGLRIANLVLTPIAVGFFMSAMGVWRARRGEELLRIDRFAYGYLFALSFALTRFWWFAK